MGRRVELLLAGRRIVVSVTSIVLVGWDDEEFGRDEIEL
jgi:hypothetical protein